MKAKAYKKAIANVLGGIAVIAAAWGLPLPFLEDPVNVAAIASLVTAACVVAGPRNDHSGEQGS